ncbi:MAG TPA: DUF4163 domain-containing protein [Rhizomicrobium sp.]|jgi:hypothetical protein
MNYWTMKALTVALLFVPPAAASAHAADYDKTEKSPLYEFGLHVPAAAMAISPLRDRILALYKADADEAKRDAKNDKEDNPSFHPYYVTTTWRVTFENDTVLSLSANTYADTGAAHPSDAFESLVWDKQAGRIVAIDALFLPGLTQKALTAIADAATKSWTKIYAQRSGQKPGPNTDVASEGISADTKKLKTYALTYAKGQRTANGIVLLYGAGEAWPHVLGDFRLSVPAAVFAKYLSPRWRPAFSPG